MAILLAAGGLLPGCESGGGSAAPAAGGRSVPLDYVEVAKLYNARTSRLDALWARTSLRVRFKDEAGEQVDETAEGHLQIVRPRKLALTVNKVGEPLFYLGSNDEFYWWLDIRKNKSAIVGRHADSDVDAVGALGVPVLPLHIVELLGVLPLDPEAEGTAKVVGERVEVSYPARGLGGSTLERPVMVRMQLDRKLFEPLLIEVRQGGKIAVRAELGAYRPVAGVGTAVAPRLAGTFNVLVPETDTRLTIKLMDVQRRGSRIPEAAFDLTKLVDAYGINKDRIKVLRPEAPAADPAAAPAAAGVRAPAAAKPPAPTTDDAAAARAPAPASRPAPAGGGGPR